MSTSATAPQPRNSRRTLALAGLVIAVLALVGTAIGANLFRRKPAPTLEAAVQSALTARNPSVSQLNAVFDRCMAEAQPDAAVQVAERLAAVAPADARSHNTLGVGLIASGESTRAAKEFQQAIALNPRMVEPYENLGRMYIDEHQPDLAMVQYDMATAVAPNSPTAWQGLGEACLLARVNSRGLDALRQSIKLNPKRPRPYAKLGLYYATNNEGTEARPYLQKALDLGDQSAELYAGLAMTLADQPTQPDDLEKALKYADEAERLGDETTFLRYARGLALQRSSRYKEAIAAYQKTIKLDATATGAWIGMSQCYRALGQVAKANEAAVAGETVLNKRQRANSLKRKVREDPTRLDVREKYAAALMDQHSYADAASEFRYIAEHRPKQPDEWLKAANAFQLAGKPELATYLRDYVKDARRQAASGHRSASPTISLPPVQRDPK